jgi:predicted RNA binding protein YcfA (HicA-like mRNA interferase family)
MSGRAEQMKLVKALKKQGFVVERTGSGHWKVTHPERDDCTYMSFSPRGTPQHKTLKRLKEMGFNG